MVNFAGELLKIFKEFINITNSENIWWALDNTSLLAVKKNGGFCEGLKKIEVMMTPESFEQLRNNHYRRIADSISNNNIKDLRAYFVDDNRDVINPQPHIIIRIIVPTTLNKVKKFASIFTKIKNYIIRKPINIKTVVNDLYDKKYEGFILLKKNNRNIAQNWIHVLSFERIKMNFEDLEAYIPVEWNTILNYWFGEDWKSEFFGNEPFDYSVPSKEIKEQI